MIRTRHNQRSAESVRKIPLRIKLFPFLNWIGLLNRESVRSDLLAGLTGAFIVLPQGVSFAMIAGLPPEYGLYTAIIPPIAAALFGSSMHLVSGPTTAISIVVFSTVAPFAEPGTADYIMMVFTLTFLAGVFQLAFGLLRLGTVINFVSHSVIVGFTAGAAILIATGQLKNALGIPVPGGASFFTTWMIIVRSTSHINPYEFGIAMITLVCAATIKHLKPRWPGLLIALVTGSVAAILIKGELHDVRLLGQLSGTLPPLSSPDFSPDTIRLLAPGALAVALLGLIEAISIARSITVFSEQHINANQEFIGQGLSNIVGSFFSAYASSGSFTRSGINYDSGAVTPLASIFATLFLTVIILLVAPLTAWLPLSAMGGVILVVAVKLVDLAHIKEIVRSSLSESLVLVATFLSTILFELEFAIYTGVLLSLAIYLTRTSHPSITAMAPDPSDPRRKLTDLENSSLMECPQLKIVRINGSLFFGAANHVSEMLEEVDRDSASKLLIVGYGINFIDVSGAAVLSHEARRREKCSKEMYLCRINRDVHSFLKQGGFLEKIGERRLFDTEHSAIATIFGSLDKRVCLSCRVRIFTECESVEYESQSFAPAES